MLLVLVSVAVEPGQCFAHHGELGLTVPLEDVCVALSEHLSDEMVSDAAGAESGSEGVT